MTQTTLDGGVWLNRFHDHYRLFEIEQLYINDEPVRNKMRAVGEIPNGDGTTECKVFNSETHSDLIRMIRAFYGDSRRDEAIREWGKNNPKVAHNFIVTHPEINGAVMKWTWTHRAKIADQGFVIKSHENEIDAEYSFAGMRGDLVDFLNKYDCWDWLFDTDEDEKKKYYIDDYGILRITHEAEDPKCYDFSYYDDGNSFPDIGDIVDNEAEEIRDFIWDLLWTKVQNNELTENQVKHKMREAGF